MPNRDKTGPSGQGPLTGRGMGPCGGGLRRGMGRGFGRFMGLRCRYWSNPVELTKEDEKKMLEQELKDIESDKEAITKRLKELK